METKFSEQLLKHLEDLSRLKLKDEERLDLKKDIEDILQYMTLLDELELDVDEMVSPIEKSLEPREDVVKAFDKVDKIRDLFPESSEAYIVVPRIYTQEKPEGDE